jgi:hypothetical protein
LDNGGVASASPGALTIHDIPAGSTSTITVGDASTPQQFDTETIFCQ